MKMTMTNEEMLKSINALATAQETGVLGYAIARNLRRLQDAAKEYLDMRDKLLEKYGTPGKAPGQVLLTPEDQKNIDNELKDIRDIESDVDVFLVSEDVFVGGDLKSNQMTALLWMVDDKKGAGKAGKD